MRTFPECGRFGRWETLARPAAIVKKNFSPAPPVGSASLNRRRDGDDFLRVRSARERAADDEFLFGNLLYPADLGDVGFTVVDGSDFHERIQRYRRVRLQTQAAGRDIDYSRPNRTALVLMKRHKC